MKNVTLINLNKVSDTKLTIQKGTKLSYSYLKHSSVGNEADFKIENEAVLVFRGSEIRYHNPERMKDPQITGADAATGKFVFEAIKAGKTRLTLQELFRFEVEEEHIFELIIED